MKATAVQRERAERFLALHRPGRPFVLGNVWDVVTALLFAREGFAAIGTSSWATAATLGLPDGQRIDPEETAALVRRLAERIALPVSADIERGYAETAEGAARAACAVFEAGAVGINLEDGTGDPDRPVEELALVGERLEATRAAADRARFHAAVNARTDVFLAAAGDRAGRLREAVARGRAFVEAGADCVFVPDMGDLDAGTIGRLAAEIGAPLNVVAGPTTPSMETLAKLGVARVSLGPRMLRAGLGLYRDIAREVLERGTFAKLTAGALSYEETTRLLSATE